VGDAAKIFTGTANNRKKLGQRSAGEEGVVKEEGEEGALL
jgi:hypothetical protein